MQTLNFLLCYAYAISILLYLVLSTKGYIDSKKQAKNTAEVFRIIGVFALGLVPIANTIIVVLALKHDYKKTQ